MGENLRAGFEDDTQKVGLAGEIRGEVLHTGVWVELVNLAYNLGVEPSALVLEVVAGNASDGGVVEAHFADGLGNAAGLVGVERVGPTRGNLAEVTPAGALRTTDEEGGFSRFPALVKVGAASFLAHGVEGGAGGALAHVF